MLMLWYCIPVWPDCVIDTVMVGDSERKKVEKFKVPKNAKIND